MVGHDPCSAFGADADTDIRMFENLLHMSLRLHLLSPERGSTHPEALCSSASTATTQSARRASTSATRAPSSRRAFTPGNDLTHSPWPLTSVQPHHCYPDLHHGKEKSTACPLFSDPRTDVDACQQREEDDTYVNICPPLWLHTGRRTLRWDRKYSEISSLNKCGETHWQFSEPFLWRRWFWLLDMELTSLWTKGSRGSESVYWDAHTKEYKHT